MKTLHKLIVMLLCLVSSGVLAVAQEEQRAFFVHRNDGDFNVMFFSQVDSMVYSRIDTDSILRDDYVTQEIWTQDTVVRIPVAAIDSITFQTPSNIYKEDAVIIDQGRQGWIEKVDSLTLYYSLSTPVYLVPEVGEKMVTTDMNDLLPVGFIGKVKSVERRSDYIVVDCDQINISDAFDRYYCIIEGKCEKTAEGKYRLKKSRDTGTVPLPTVDLSKSVDFSYGWKYNDYCQYGGGIGVSVKCVTEPSLYYVCVEELDDYFVSLRLDFDHTLATTSTLYGNFKIGGDIEPAARVDVPVEAIPFTKFYIKGGLRFEFNGNLALDFERTDEFHSAYVFSKSSNKNIPFKNRFIPLTHIGGDYNVKKLIGSLSLYGGLYLEVGYGLLIEDLAKIYGRLDAGLEFVLEADLAKSIDNAPNSPELYEKAGDLMTFGINLAYGGSCGIGMELGDFQTGVSLGAMIKENLFTLGLFPSFENVEFVKNEGSDSYLKTDIDKKLLAAVPVGFKVYDENGNMVFKEYYTDDYSGSFNEYRIPYTFNKVNTTYTAYPVFKLFGEYEVLASPGVEMKSEVSPVTVGGEAISSDEASISGRLDGDYKFLEVGGYSVGFLYGESAELQESGTSIVVGLNADGTFGSKLIKLKDGTTYYYCAYLKVGGKIYYGEVKSFATPKIPKDAVDLGLSVLWAKYNVGASKEGDCGGLYGWADATGSQTAFDVMSEDGTTWTSPLYGGANPPVSISGNASYDIASSKWGGGWRMPTEAEMIELIDNCTTEYEEIDGVSGVRFTSTINGESIFMPMAGDRFGTEMRETGYTGYYWTGTLNTDNRFNAYRMNFTAAGAEWDNYPRYIGHSVRPVIAKP